MSLSTDPAAQLFDAIRAGDTAQVRLLLTSHPQLSNARNSDGATSVLWAVYTRHPDLAPILLAGRDPDFFEACALGQTTRVAEVLQDTAAILETYSGDGFTALGLAVFFGHVDLARRLLTAGADPNRASKNSFRVAPLHSAVAAGSLELLDLLLSFHAQLDPVEFLGATPLHSAAAHGSREMVLKLLAAGADPQRKTNEGKTPSDLARQYNHPELIADLETPPQ